MQQELRWRLSRMAAAGLACQDRAHDDPVHGRNRHHVEPPNAVMEEHQRAHGKTGRRVLVPVDRQDHVEMGIDDFQYDFMFAHRTDREYAHAVFHARLGAADGGGKFASWPTSFKDSRRTAAFRRRINASIHFGVRAANSR